MPFREGEQFLKHFLGNTKEESEALYREYKTTLTGLAGRYAMFNNVDENDLVQEGTIGLARAVRDFDKQRSVNFNTFAIYKIKDAMREFVSKQANDVKIPQYIKEATRLITKLTKLMDKVSPLKEKSYDTVWQESSLFDEESEIIRDINEIRHSISNLAERSGTNVGQLLERAELYPADITDVDDVVYNMGDMSGIAAESVEDDIVSKLMAHVSIEKLKEIITEEEYNLLYAHYVDGMTVRQLEPEIGIRAASITVRIHNILKRIQNKKEQLMTS